MEVVEEVKVAEVVKALLRNSRESESLEIVDIVIYQ
jgi:hypothetical protein